MHGFRLAMAALLGVLATVAPPTRALAAGVATQGLRVATPPRTSPAFEARIAIAKRAMMADPEKGLDEATAAASLAASLADPTGRTIALATAHWLQGEALMRLNKPEAADPLLADALLQVQRYQPGSKLDGDLLQASGEVSAMRGRVQQALEDFQGAHRTLQKIGDSRGEARALMNIGSIYNDAGDYERVLQYQAQAADAYSGDPAFAVSSHNNRGNALRELHRIPEAEAEYRLALVAARALDSPLLQARILTNLASAQELGGRFADADASADRGLRIAADATAAGWRPFLWGVKAQAAFKRGDLAGASTYIGRAFAGVDLTHTTMPYREFHDFAHAIYGRLGDDRLALAHLEAFKRLDDESRTLAASTNAALMSARFDFANQDLRITRLKTGQLERDVLIAKSRARLHGILMAGGGAAFLLLLIGYVSIRRSRNEVRAANGNLSSANTALEKALRAKTEFLATTSHEIRTPLNGILGMTQVILHDPGIAGQLRERIQVVHGAGETMKALVDDILDVAKMETGHLVIHRVEMDLKQVVEDAARLWTGQARGKGIGLDVDLADCPTRIIEDETRLRQILFNLLSNATKFTEQGGVRLTVSTDADAAGERLIVRVADTGIGIAEEHLASIFESFRQVDGGTTRRFGGTGLGLAICRNLSRAMGGDVAVESEPEAGSTFTLTLPLVRIAAAPAAAEPSRDAQGRPSRLGDCRLLVIDRNPLAQSIIRAVIESEVAAFEVAESGDEALTMIGERAFDEIVVEGASAIVGSLDRFQSVRALAAAAPHAAVTVLAADLTDPDRVGLVEAGAARVLAKPISAKALLDALKASHVAPPGPAELTAVLAADRKSAA